VLAGKPEHFGGDVFDPPQLPIAVAASALVMRRRALSVLLLRLASDPRQAAQRTEAPVEQLGLARRGQHDTGRLTLVEQLEKRTDERPGVEHNPTGEGHRRRERDELGTAERGEDRAATAARPGIEEALERRRDQREGRPQRLCAEQRAIAAGTMFEVRQLVLYLDLSAAIRAVGRHLDEDREDPERVLHPKQIEENGVAEIRCRELAVKHRTPFSSVR
jgi:hypothetical protein